MQAYQKAFIEFAIENGVLRFGEFELKSGRISPYFFNTGLFNSGTSLARLGRFYADAISANNIEFDMLFGPAYKGIPLATSIAIAFAAEHGRDVPVCFNRKEEKDHGEGGATIGAPLAGRVLIVDDVISAGTSVNQSLALIDNAGAAPAGVMISLDRQEKGHGDASAIDAVRERFNVAVYSIVTLVHILDFLEQRGDAAHQVAAIRRYRDLYGV